LKSQAGEVIQGQLEIEDLAIQQSLLIKELAIQGGAPSLEELKESVRQLTRTPLRSAISKLPLLVHEHALTILLRNASNAIDYEENIPLAYGYLRRAREIASQDDDLLGRGQNFRENLSKAFLKFEMRLFAERAQKD
jgi:hypothetical protein